MIFKTILVPYDGSAMSDKALDKAVELAKILKESRIMIIHVVPEIPTPIFSRVIRSPKTGEVITFSEYMKSLYQEIESKMRERLEERKEKYNKYGYKIRLYLLKKVLIHFILFSININKYNPNIRYCVYSAIICILLVVANAR
ncbi:MAG TPA: universal stress protein [Nitrososphaeraceae archaeon]|nr:universal stress protein [Nitrososphaeraceae archaeon]